MIGGSCHERWNAFYFYYRLAFVLFNDCTCPKVNLVSLELNFSMRRWPYCCTSEKAFVRVKSGLCFRRFTWKSLRMSFRKSISQTLVFGQLLGLMPICGITSDFSDLKFKWKSFRCLHFAVVSLGAASLLILMLLFLHQHREFSLENIDTVVVYSTNIITIVLFFRLRHKWPKLIEFWDNFECRLNLNDSEHRQQSNLRLMLVVTSSLGKLSLTSNENVQQFSFKNPSRKKKVDTWFPSAMTLSSLKCIFSGVHASNVDRPVTRKRVRGFESGDGFLRSNVPGCVCCRQLPPFDGIHVQSRELRDRTDVGLQRPLRDKSCRISQPSLQQVQRPTVEAQGLRNAAKLLASAAVALPWHYGFGQRSRQNDLRDNFSLVRRQSLFHLRSFVQRPLVRRSRSSSACKINEVPYFFL